MNQNNIFSINEIPYGQLKNYGITRTMLLDMPKQALSSILNGKLSPLLAINGSDGLTYPSKIRLKRDGQGHVMVIISPKLKEMDVKRHNLDKEEAERLRKGEVILKDGKYMKFDKETNQVIETEASKIKIEKRLAEILESVEDIKLGEVQKQRIREGKPVELKKGDTTVTVGIDLDTKTGVRLLKGDLDMWRRRQLVEWDRITPGATGYWQTSENGWQYEKYKEDRQERNTGRHSSGRTRR